MTVKRKFTIAALITSAAALMALLLLAPASKAQAQGQSKGSGVSVSGTIYGHYRPDPDDSANYAWIAKAMLSFGNQSPVSVVIIDRGVEGKRGHENNGGGWSGSEVWTVTFNDPNDSFQVVATYQASPTSAPNLWTLHETGYLTKGTGKYAHISGQITVQGPFVLPDGWPDDESAGEPHWISEIHGTVHGLE